MFRHVLSAALLSVFIASSPCFSVSADDNDDATIQQALKYIQTGNISKGVATLQYLAEAGNADAMFHVAEINRLGIGRDVNIPIATMYYRFAAELGHERAALTLANILYFDDQHTPKNMAQALDIWQTMSLKGNLEATYMLGMIYWNGEDGIKRDPIRGYALVWLASEGGYEDAEQNLLSMRALLSAKAKDAAVAYAKNLKQRGFSEKPIVAETGASEKAVAQQDVMPHTKALTPPPAASEEKLPTLKKPDDWLKFWRIEVGYAMSELEIKRLQSVIASTKSIAMDDLFSDVIPSPSRPGLFRLVYGPAPSMTAAVTRCVELKRAGYDCAVRPPEEDDDEGYAY